MEECAQRMARDAFPFDTVRRRLLELMECGFQLSDDLLGSTGILRRNNEAHVRRHHLRGKLPFYEFDIGFVLFEIRRLLLLLSFFVFIIATEKCLPYFACRFAQE
jgi:hypothetical protein